ncbi:MAG: NAD(P)/FAD-dependent oxidoreductase [Lachnospiraceae bacterium]|nr:NAD(P)/FAD-dependent oxidoreductase [Lachnospiraceae bacterium]
MADLTIIGGGAAGMAAAVFAAEAGLKVHLFEQNEKLGKKVFITGKGRCNFTNACDIENLFSSVVTNSKFLYSSFYGFTNQQTIEWFESLGVRTKVERGDRAFPVSDHSSDIIRALERRLKELGVKIHLNSPVESLLLNQEGTAAAGVRLKNGYEQKADAVLIATGGFSYQTTGSTGDGYRFAQGAGHAVSGIRPALVPLVTGEEYIPRMQGLSLKNVSLTIRNGKKKLFEEFGELLFTHFGISGPLALKASSYIGKTLEKTDLQAVLDLKPALTKDQLSARLVREFEDAPNKQFRNILPNLFPAKMIPVILELGGIDPYTVNNTITREQREHFSEVVKAFPFSIVGTRGYNEAIITQGGVKVKEVNPSTMESKLVQGLYFAGEVLDLDAVTGGFNLQIAWSTAHTAAIAAAEAQLES